MVSLRIRWCNTSIVFFCMIWLYFSCIEVVSEFLYPIRPFFYCYYVISHWSEYLRAGFFIGDFNISRGSIIRCFTVDPIRLTLFLLLLFMEVYRELFSELYWLQNFNCFYRPKTLYLNFPLVVPFFKLHLLLN